MVTATTTFEIPIEIARRLASGDCQRFGGVVRDNSGRLVLMLKPVVERARHVPKKPIIVIAVLLAAAAAGGAIVLYARFNRKARMARQLAKVDRQISKTFVEHASELSIDNLIDIRTSIDEYLRLANEMSDSEIKLALPESDRQRIIAFADALRMLSEHLRSQSLTVDPVPALPGAEPTTDLNKILRAIGDQLDYQKSHWPAMTQDAPSAS